MMVFILKAVVIPLVSGIIVGFVMVKCLINRMVSKLTEE